MYRIAIPFDEQMFPPVRSAAASHAAKPASKATSSDNTMAGGRRFHSLHRFARVLSIRCKWNKGHPHRSTRSFGRDLWRAARRFFCQRRVESSFSAACFPFHLVAASKVWEVFRVIELGVRDERGRQLGMGE